MKFNALHYELYKDLFDYYREIQKINKGFRLYFNKKNKVFSIVNIYNNFEICNNFKSIFEIDLHNLRFSQINNFNKIINHIEEYNNHLEDLNNIKQQEMLKYSVNELNKISNRSNNLKFNDINKIIGASKC